MGLLGRLLVLIYGAGALLCLMWAAMVYTQKMDFVTPKGAEGGKKAMSRVEEAQKTTKQLQIAINRSYTRWRQEFDDVVRLEVDANQRREFYRGQLELVRTGKYQGNDVPEPVQELEYEDDDTSVPRLLKIDNPTGRKPVLVRSEDMAKKEASEKAKWMGFYLQGIEQAGRQMTALQAETAKLIDAHKESTLIMSGREAPFVKGLRKRIKEQEQIEIDAKLETTFLEDFITNRRAEAQLFVKRRDSLVARLNELRKYYKDKTPGGQGN
jgi:hypothetical protein